MSENMAVPVNPALADPSLAGRAVSVPGADPMPTPARREISAIEISAPGSAKAMRAASRIRSRLRAASERLGGSGAGVSGDIVRK